MTTPVAPKRQNGVAISTIRKIRGISRDELVLQLGISYPYFANIENEHKDGTPELIHRIARVLDVPVAAIVRRPLMAAEAEQVPA